MLSVGLVACGENEGSNSNGAITPPSTCASIGSACVGEGSVCGTSTCHCGFEVPASSAAASQPCQQQNTCTVGMACAAGSSSCNGLDCYCGFWATKEMEQKFSCGSGGSGGTGGSGGSGGASGQAGTGGAAPAPSGTHSLHISIVSPHSTHIWCEGAASEINEAAGANVKFYENWHSFGCDSYDGKYDCDIAVQSGTEEQFQCYLLDPEDKPADAQDDLRYTCASPAQFVSGESFSTSIDGTVVNVDLIANASPANQTKVQFYNCAWVQK